MLGESAVKMSNEVDGQSEEARPFVNPLDWASQNHIDGIHMTQQST